MNEIVKGKRCGHAGHRLRLARFTSTEPEFWLNLQQAVDLWNALRSEQAAELDSNQAGSSGLRAQRGQRSLPNDSGFLLRDHNADPGPRGASRVVRDPDAHRVSSKP